MSKRMLVLVLLCLMVVVLAVGSTTGVAQSKYTLIYASEDHELYPPTLGIREFARIVEEKTKGNVTVKIHLNGSLGDERAQVESTMIGSLDLGRPALNRLVYWEKDWEVWNLPYLVTNFEDGATLMKGETFTKMAQDLQKKHGVRILAVYPQGFRCVSNNRRPINAIGDLRGLKMRVSPTPLFVKTYELLGAQPVSMAFGEVFSALKQNVVDGYENDPASHVANGFMETGKYFAVTNTVFYNGLLIMNERRFQRMPKEYQTIILEAAKVAEEVVTKATIAQTETAIQDMVDAGVTVTYPDLAPFRDAVGPIYDEFRTSLSRGLVDRVLAEVDAL